MKIGDYVRTKNGIAKIIGKNDDVRYHYPNAWITDTYLEINDDTEYVYDEDIIKSSPNIIDLIEAGDYVSGLKIEEIYCCAEYEGLGYYDENDRGQLYVLLNEIDIKSILTKEQFERMEYKLGGM
ncbi:MAG: hypothetical protein VZR33_02440 [Methanosphaera sp.]|nr:hypothetical protein [Methanosphaera sp.]